MTLNAGARVQAGSLPVRLTAGAGKRATGIARAEVEVEVKDRSLASKAGIDGLLLKVRRADSATADTPATTPLTVDLDYRRFRNAYGGDWGSRLTFVALPECVLTTPGKPECQKRTPVTTRNNAATDTLTATVVPPVAARSSRTTAAPAMVLAAAAGAQGTNGDYRATSLSPSGAWQGGGASGDFSWSYPMDIPASLGGPGPSLALSYSSASVDGRTSATSQQASWVGDGWDLGSNFIERTYLPCAEDRKEGSGYNNPKNPTGDLCQGPPVVTMSLNGSSTQLVLSDKDKTWRPAADDGSRVELKTGAIGNGDKETEYWVVTDAKGVQYHFGRHRLPGWDTADPDQRTITNSTWNVPVYGNHPGEPCYKAAYAEAVCDQAWRWNLDYVVDPRGNVMTYWYTKERNHYGSNVQEDGKSTSRPYDRGGWLKKISYGLREENPFAPAPAQVTFGIGERCLKTTAFKCEEDKLTDEATPEVARNWPDVPADQLCDAGKECKDRYAPAFFTRKLLTGVHTWVLKDGKPEPVDSWTLTQDFPSTGDGGVNGEYPLWLSQIRHTGKNGTPISLPPVTFKGKQLPNRVDNNADGNPPYLRWRVEVITTETGARIAVEYAEPECSAKAPKKLPSAPESNTLRCYPVVLETPDPTDPTGRKKVYKTDWFHKHRVEEIREEDARNISPTKRTRYEYVGTPAWAYDDESENVSDKVRTWSQWRGYERVRTLVGSAPEKRSLVENRYFRGMDGDKQPGEPGGRRSATIVDSEGGKALDHEEFAGQLRETLYYNGEDGALQSATLYTPWRHGPTATRKREGASPLEAWVQGTTEVASRTILSGDREQRRTKVQHKFDERGLIQHTTDHGDLSRTDDNSCVRYEYLEDTKQWIIALQTRIETTAKACDATDVKRPDDVIDDKRLHYDAKGNVDRAESLSAYTDGKPVYSLTGTTTVDTYGRPTSATDIYGKTTKTQYTPPSGSVATKVVTTNALGHASATEIDPGRGLVLAQEDANERRNVMEYDALGRLTKVWSPDRNPTTQIPDAEFSYDVRPDGPVVITNKKLLERGDYRVSHDIYDGLLRLRQTQQEAIDSGRAITDTFYDSRGLVWKENGAYFNDKEPEPQLWASDDNKVPSSTRTEFDGMGRPVATIARKFGVETWRTTTSYGGDWVAVDPPRGDTPTKSLLDAKGRKTQLQQFKGDSPTGTAFDRTAYKYNAHGRLESVTDQAGNVWSYKYDLRGRLHETRDPDKGTTTVTYDKGDRVESVSDGRTPRRKIAFAYDEIGRPKATHEGSVATGTKLTEQTYDTLPGGLGLPVASTRYVDGNAYTQAVTGYDAEYRPRGSKITIPASEGKLAGDYTYTNTYTTTVGLPQTVTHPAAGGLPSERVAFGYHGFDQVTGMSVAGKTFVSTTNYTPLGDVLRTHIGTFAQQLLSTHEFDEQTRRPTRTVHDQESTVGDAVVTTRISDTRTAYDQVGNVLKITDAQGANPTPATTDTQCFAYDYQRRMTDAWTATDDCAAKPTPGVSAGPKVGGPDPYWHSYTFDAVGNRQTEVRHDPGGNTAKDITSAYTYAKGLSTGSRLESVLTKGPQGERKDTFEYDGAGNTTKRTVDNTAAPGTGPEVDPTPQILSWDVEGHLEQVEKGSEKTSYVYDAGGNRLIRRDPSGTTLYLPGTEIKLGKDGAVAKGTRYYTHPAGPTMVRTAEGGKITTSYLLPDRNGTATTSVDAASKSVTRRKFTPFGEERGAKPSTWPGERGYLGGTMDESTGLTHLGAREYDPSLGRFISVDPQMDTAESQTMNPYAYGNNSPVTFSDPTGRAFCADEACRTRVPVGGGSSGGGGGGDKGYSDGSDSGGGAVPPAPAKPVPTVSQEDVERARLLKQQSKMDAVKRIAMEVLKDASGYNDVVSCIGGDLGTCAMLALEAAVPWAGKAKRIVKALDRAWSAYNKWEDEVRWAIGTMRRADQDAAAMAKYAEDMASWKKKADAAKAAKKADEAAAEAAKKADSGGGGGGGDGGGGGASCPISNSFTPETKVLLADGTAKAIKDLKPGDKVQATDPKTGKTKAKTVDATIKGKGAKNLVKLTVDVDGTKGTKTSTVTATDGHPFWVPELADWIDATDLRAGQWLQTGTGTRVQITTIERRTERATVHNLTVSDYHTYYVLAGATPVLVHNCNDGYADVYFDDVEGHASVSVTHGDTTMHTEAGSQPGSNSVPGVRTRPHSPGTIVVRVPLPNARNAQRAQYAMEDVNLGPHDNDTNNCVTYCARILRAGGVDVPANDSQNIAGWLLNSSHPQRRL
ncbi:Rhs family-like protein [Streptomyces lincolnensis]|uniref:polymorphic toxin-type HINT domain-containing protein n=1 Tax=Streptomyces lincolnensis TaxID=1915 RepID=UPI001E61CB92|nr:polymorphic toxin-type HINT domain-containing protein [Streptomyces lincolnensis]MCD7444194.1 Rhs family-like protein [Streptomyces lincolnensis]